MWRELLANTLQSQFRIVLASTVEDAIIAVDNDPDIKCVVMDLVLTAVENVTGPRFGGLRLIQALKKKKPGIKTIVMSSFLGDHQEDLFKLGVDQFISKSSIVAEPGDVRRFVKDILSQLEIDNHQDQGQSRVIASIRETIAAELEKYAAVKDRILNVPGEGNFELIKPLIGFKKDIEERILHHPFAQNVFLMMKFRGFNKELGDFIIETLDRYGLQGVRADQDEWNITRNVYNPIAVLFCCKFGLALFDEAEPHQAYSPNVAYELGMMHLQNKECLILRHSSLPQIPFDLTKDLHSVYERELQVRSLIESWIKQVAGKPRAL